MHKGDIFFTRTSETIEEIGFPSVMLSEPQDTVFSGFVLRGRSLEKPGQLVNIFKKYVFFTNAFRKEMVTKSSMTTRALTSGTALSAMRVKFPLEATEQKKIGELITRLDYLIAANEDKLEQLKTLKKLMMQKIFSQEWRFKGFTDPWEQRKLTDVANYRNGKAHEKNVSPDGRYIIVNSKFVSTNGKVIKKTDTMIAPLHKNEIAFVLSDVPNGRAIARTFFVQENSKYSLNQRIAGITPKSSTDSYFLNLLMNRNTYFLKFDDHVGQTNLSKSVVENFAEFYPDYGEQVTIGIIIKKISNLIAANEDKLNQLKKLKKYLMQNMFV
ncbi:hypothetical protein FD10_GL000282 [Lactiplantibacillus argentoratensis DSM 16365]|uniref:restriction endonuclease subunit S n=1 Tax=Lactiplantibacillus argentoratensis TaxID=271881 RepID=UPI0006F183D3|nr:restriction endonuclease subunit S [Lactiplantibacillus argentoratensis]KRL96701.1 hypothetical protein FD10_GL000282 [Lactiplantibacillus argentoratensis DSM 16365]